MLKLQPANRVPRGFALTLALLASLVVTTPAHAAEQRTNGPIVYAQGTALTAANPDRTNRRDLGTGRTPAVAPDGLRMAIVEQVAGNDEIYRAGLDGGGAVNLSRSAGQDTDPSWSVTGRIAFASTRAGGSHIYDMDTHGVGVRQLTVGPAADTQPSWSPDGRSLVFVRGGTDLFVYDAGTQAVRQLTADGAPKADPAWGPDGAIAFAAGPEGARRVLTVAADGTGLRTLTARPAGGSQPTWSPDGTEIAYVEGSGPAPELRVMSATKGDADMSAPLGAGLDGPAWAPLAASGRPEGGRTVDLRSVHGTVRIRPGVANAEGTLPIVVHGPVLAPSTLTLDATDGSVKIVINARQSGVDRTTLTVANGIYTIEQNSVNEPPVIEVQGDSPQPCKKKARASRLVDPYIKVKGKGKYLGYHGRASAVGTVWSAKEECFGTQLGASQGEIKTEAAEGAKGVSIDPHTVVYADRKTRTKVRKLWGSHGSFRSAGRFSAATVRG